MEKILVIQTAFIGDVILATSFIESLSIKFPNATIDCLVRDGNQGLLKNNPKLQNLLVWEKKSAKLRNLFKLAKEIRKQRYDRIYNLHRFASSGLITFLSKAKFKAGFSKNPFSFSYQKKVKHQIPHKSGPGYFHEIQRNAQLLDETKPALPKLYPSAADFAKAKAFTNDNKYVVVAPASVWFTKQWPINKWKELMAVIPNQLDVFIIGAPNDAKLGDELCNNSGRVTNLCGKMGLLESAALIKNAERVFVNDSAPLHLASAMNAPTTAIFCATRPALGFGPLADGSKTVEAAEGCCSSSIHGQKACPQGHFNCAQKISADQVFTPAETHQVGLGQDAKQQSAKACQLLESGAVLLCQSDTVPGLSADATNSLAVEKILELKKRSANKGFVLLCSDWKMAANYVKLPEGAVFQELKHSSKAISQVLPGLKVLDDELLGQDGSLAIRVVRQKDLQSMIRDFGKPIVSSSANISGNTNPQRWLDVDLALQKQVDGFFYFPASDIVNPSTLIKWEGGTYSILRGEL